MCRNHIEFAPSYTFLEIVEELYAWSIVPRSLPGHLEHGLEAPGFHQPLARTGRLNHSFVRSLVKGLYRLE
jgi:hypothetical protein